MSTIHESIVLIGGGGGVYRVARFLKHVRPNITTIQTMFDAGGHSRQLRDERGMLPPGDIRQAILALSDDSIEESLRVFMSHRFLAKNNSSLDNATLGNLMLTALTEHYNGDIIVAINEMCRIFRVRGKILPVSLDHSHLCVLLSDGSTVHGEGAIDTRSNADDRTIVSAHLEPKANIYIGAYDAIVEADKIVFCPGDLFTSVIPNTLVAGFPEAIQESKAKVIFAVNIMTKKSETPGYSASRFAKTLLQYIQRPNFDAVICNSRIKAIDVLAKYKQEHAHPVEIDQENLKLYAERIITRDLADLSGGVIRHNQTIASIIADI